MSGIDWQKRVERILKYCYCGPDGTPGGGVSSAVLQLGREMADARAEEIAKAIEDTKNMHSWSIQGICAGIARSFISKPQTREQVLEEALLRIQRHVIADAEVPGEAETVGDIATDALDWKP